MPANPIPRNETQAPTPRRFIPQAEARRLLGLTPSQFDRLRKEQGFPIGIKMAGGSNSPVVFDVAQIAEWQEVAIARAAELNAAASRRAAAACRKRWAKSEDAAAEVLS